MASPGQRLRLPLLALLAACGPSVAPAPALDEEKIANRAAEIVLRRLQTIHGLGATASADWPSDDDPAFDERLAVPTADRPARGASDPLVTIVVFSDFQCPFCSRVVPTLEQILRAHPDDVRLVFRHNPLPFHTRAEEAAEATMEAHAQQGDAAFWAMHDLLFENQRALERADLVRYARSIGLDVARFERALDDDTHLDAIRADMALAQRLDARGTPTFFLNGRKLVGAQPFETFEATVQEELRIAEAAMEGGVPRGRLYERLLAAVPAARPEVEEPAPPTARAEPDPAAVYRVPVTDEPQRGPDDALVTIVMIGDFECPFSARVRPTLERILTEYGNDVRLVWMNNPLPFHRNAPVAHRAALEAHEQGGDRGFWRMHDVIFDNQRELGRDRLLGYARMLGLNAQEMRQALDGDDHADIIEREQQLARSLGATGTPAFFINGRNVRGAQPFEVFRTVIDEELVRARAAIQRGVPRARIYEELTADGATSPQFVGGEGPGAAAPDEPERYQVPVPADAPRLGASQPVLVIQEISDYECPFCSRVQPTIERIMQEYGNRVQLVWRHHPLPFHTHARLAHQAAIEIRRQRGDEAFWRYTDILFANQRALERADLERYAQQIGGVNMARFRRALDRGTHDARIEQDLEAIRQSGARIGTPSFLIGDRLVQGAQPYETFQAAIEAELPSP